MKLAELRLRSLTNINFVFTAPPNKSLDASGGSASRNKLGAAQGALICAAASTLTLRSVSEPGAVATGSQAQRCHTRSPFLSPARGLGSLGDVIPGLRSLRSLTRGYYLPPLRGSLTMNPKLSVRSDRSVSFYGATQQLAGPGARGACFSTVTRSHPPPHAGCPRGDPGPLPVLTSL